MIIGKNRFFAFVRFVFTSVAAVVICVSTVHAQVSGPATVVKPGFSSAAALDRIFTELKEAPNDSVARYKTEEMWKIFLMTPDTETADDMNRAIRARRGFDFEKAIEILEGIIARHPDYAEAWNQLATIRFLQRDFDASLKDCEKVLALEPRHLGCLSGMAIIHIRHKKNYDKGREVLARAMTLHPRIGEKALLLEIPEGE